MSVVLPPISPTSAFETDSPLLLSDLPFPVTESLGGLFFSLQYSDTAFITPEKDLAYLALVTPKDEESDGPALIEAPSAPAAGEAAAIASSATVTDTGLVDEPMADAPSAISTDAAPFLPSISQSESLSATLLTSPSILGKRSSQDRDLAELMDVDASLTVPPPSISLTTENSTTSSLESDASTIPSPPSSPIASSPAQSISSPTSRKALRQDSNVSASRSIRATSAVPEEVVSSAQAPRVDDVDAAAVAQLLPAAEPSAGSLPLVDGATPPPPAPIQPPLPPRRAASSLTSDGPMMFGKWIMSAVYL